MAITPQNAEFETKFAITETKRKSFFDVFYHCTPLNIIFRPLLTKTPLLTAFS